MRKQQFGDILNNSMRRTFSLKQPIKKTIFVIVAIVPKILTENSFFYFKFGKICNPKNKTNQNLFILFITATVTLVYKNCELSEVIYLIMFLNVLKKTSTRRRSGSFVKEKLSE